MVKSNVRMQYEGTCEKCQSLIHMEAQWKNGL